MFLCSFFNEIVHSTSGHTQDGMNKEWGYSVNTYLLHIGLFAAKRVESAWLDSLVCLCLHLPAGHSWD